MDPSFRLIDFNIYNQSSHHRGRDNKEFMIQMFGLDEKSNTYSVKVKGFQPFFYVKVSETWTESTKKNFVESIITKVGKFYRYSITECTLMKKKKLYGFDAGKEYQFLQLTFTNTSALNKVKNLWYDTIELTKEEKKKSLWGTKRVLKENGFIYQGCRTRIYESAIPPLLRYFHIQNISPSGWITFSTEEGQQIKNKRTTCDYEYMIHYRHIVALPQKETQVPIKICSFDIEASSSHGDFPLPKKTYKKLVMDILDYWDREEIDDEQDIQQDILRKIILTAFGMDDVPGIHRLHLKGATPSYKKINDKINRWLHEPVRQQTDGVYIGESVKRIDEGEEHNYKWWKSKPKVKDTILDVLNNKKFDRGDKLEEIDKTFIQGFPSIKGDKVTFIGSTFMLLGEQESYMDHCIALDTCDDIPDATIESYATEQEVLLAWTDIIQHENPDIIIGYNIFGFDFKFMVDRSEELNCKDAFLQLSRNKGEICKMKKSSIHIASGVHELQYIHMPGRILIDLYNYFRRNYNLSSYKLDNVASHFIGDNVSDYTYTETATCLQSKNLMGLHNGNYIRFEEIGHSTDSYADGKKFIVFDVDEERGTFCIKDRVDLNRKKIMRWCLAKDDVTPQDIFRLTNEGSKERAIIAKYCIQDCNLVHYLMTKNDILTGFIEVASICSVPIGFIVMRGQGIKLLSFISKKCREKNILMPDIQKGGSNEGYEGAICLPPKCDLYLDNPVAVVDYGSLYPSSMISENISHDSKVWTKEYNLTGELIAETGDDTYDNLPEYDYVDIEYDTYKWIRKRKGGREIKTKVGTKMCRFAQFPEDNKAVMPSILVELLSARKATRSLIKYKTIVTKDGSEFSGLLSKKGGYHMITQKDKTTTTIEDEQVVSVRDTYNDFMKNVFDKRQQGYKITANSLYGQCGAKTSSFYDKDIAASTTATGRKLLIYAKHVIEEVYKNRICETRFGRVRTHADCIYGDTDSCFFTFNLEDISGQKIRGKRALEITIELAQEAGALATKMLKMPHDLEYEKTFLPFALLSKKRYVGMLYEYDVNKCKRKSMGIVLKRRDNAPIVKDIYGGVIDILMKQKDIQAAVEFTKQCIADMLDEKIPMRKLIITKSLRGFYKNPRTIAHKVLAERMGKRDPGNKPRVGARIPFAYIQTKGKRLQGDKIEHPDFIRAHKLKLDYSIYITNQIMKPILQLFALPYVLNNIPAFRRRRQTFSIILETAKQMMDEEKYAKKCIELRNKEVKVLLFDEFLRRANNKKKGHQNINKFFKAV